MTGLSFRLGAGCWEPMSAMVTEAYTVRFADHWAFEGTGLRDGEQFARGALGYETDAAELDESGGAPRVTGRDGTPGSFTVLATADLRHWAAHGQGGAATMGVFTAGRGTVFNAGTVNWGAALGDPVVARITGNVLDRLARPASAVPAWTAAGTRDEVVALAAAGSALYAVLAARGPAGPVLGTREACGQALPWRPIGGAADLVALAAPRDAVAGAPGGLYALRRDGAVLRRPVGPATAPWALAGAGPPGPGRWPWRTTISSCSTRPGPSGRCRWATSAGPPAPGPRSTLAGRPRAGRTLATRSRAGRSRAGRSVAGRSLAGRRGGWSR